MLLQLRPWYCSVSSISILVRTHWDPHSLCLRQAQIHRKHLTCWIHRHFWRWDAGLWSHSECLAETPSGSVCSFLPLRWSHLVGSYLWLSAQEVTWSKISFLGLYSHVWKVSWSTISSFRDQSPSNHQIVVSLRHLLGWEPGIKFWCIPPLQTVFGGVARFPHRWSPSRDLFWSLSRCLGSNWLSPRLHGISDRPHRYSFECYSTTIMHPVDRKSHLWNRYQFQSRICLIVWKWDGPWLKKKATS